MSQDLQADRAMPRDARELLDFWRDAGPSRWFAKDEAFDAAFAGRFRDAHDAAARLDLESWVLQPGSALALILLLDQYPRNAFRGTGHMFATDGLALRYARQALAADFLPRIEPALRNFVCLPFMHAETLRVQEESVALYTAQVPDSLYWAIEHHAIIQRFGRFPHRNAVLGRDTTPEERRFLDEGGFAG
ncbi:DUF924 family protein [Castellaniella sp. GW247-6E4]|uniref:DUF924 family protein n=1 Tax=Castellaniella sp. GW247-6E4 TaxID=3140380 RepID=UPI0033146519